LSCAVALGQRVLQDGDQAVASYLDFLGAGGSDYPLATLAKAGIDLSTVAPIEAAMAEFAATLDEFKALIG